MLLEIFTFIAALSLGVIAGIITGLTPGIHINLIGALLISSSIFLTKYTSPINLVIFIVAMSITHTFIDFIPSIFLGAPEEDTVLSVLPGHQLLKQGLGYEAVLLSAYGSLGGIFLIILIFPITIYVLPKMNHILIQIIPFILIIVSLFLILSEKTISNKFISLVIFIIAGFLGLGVLNSGINEPLLPMLTGLFGVSSLIVSIQTKIKIPIQDIKIKINNKYENIVKPTLISLIPSLICATIPGMGSGQAAIIGSSLTKSDNKKFITLLGTTNTLIVGISFFVLYSIGKSRTGSAIFINALEPNLTMILLLLIILTIFISGIISFFLTIQLGKLFSRKIPSINYTYLSSVIIIFLVILTLLISNFQGLFVLIVSSILGIYAIKSGVKRTSMMGCLIIPTILIYLL